MSVALYNSIGCAVPLIWILLNSQSTLYLISNPKTLVKIRMVLEKYSIHIHCNSGVKVVNQDGNIFGYGTV